MPNFTYEALNEAGQPQKGQIAADSTEEASKRLRSQGLFPTTMREQKVKKRGGTNAAGTTAGGKKKKKGEFTINIGGVGTKVLTTFTRQLSTLQDAGLPILRSLAILAAQQKPGLFKNVLEEVHDSVSNGSTLSDAMAAHPKAFNRLYCKMITAGEVGGVLDLILARLAEFMEKAARLRRHIVGAMIYPIAVVSIASLILLGIMLLIVPNFRKIFDDFDTALPLMTSVLIDSSSWLAGKMPGQRLPGAILLVFAPALIILGYKVSRKTQIGQAVIDTILLKVPIVGSLISKATIAKFTRTLGTLINAGVPILDAITITRDTTGNYVFARALSKVHDSVRQGESFSEPLASAKVCDPIVVNMIDVGEETGDLDKMMVRVADNYEEEVDVAVSGLVSLLEPIMVVFLGGMVGFIVIALFLPMVKLIQTMM